MKDLELQPAGAEESALGETEMSMTRELVKNLHEHSLHKIFQAATRTKLSKQHVNLTRGRPQTVSVKAIKSAPRAGKLEPA